MFNRYRGNKKKQEIDMERWHAEIGNIYTAYN
jgi:hypothetical protein